VDRDVSAFDNMALASQADTLVQEVDGLCVFDSLAIQLQIHANDSRERRTLSQRFPMPAQLTVMLLLEGDVRVSINETTCLMSARNGPAGYLWLVTQPGLLVRHMQAGQRVRKVNVSVPIHGISGIHLPTELREHICLDSPRSSVASWSPSPHALRCAQEILTQHDRTDGVHSLETYVAGLSMFQQALSVSHEGIRRDAHVSPLHVKARDMARARKIRERIVASESHATATLQVLAQELGMSVSTLQRLFKAAYGTSVVSFQRTERLKTARTKLLQGRMTVGEAGYQAGYSNVSNFSSAFQKAFGYPPSVCTR
jgi:AraC-like DNA-binding protein